MIKRSQTNSRLSFLHLEDFMCAIEKLCNRAEKCAIYCNIQLLICKSGFLVIRPVDKQVCRQKGARSFFFKKVHALGRALTNKTSHAHGEKFSLIFVE